MADLALSQIGDYIIQIANVEFVQENISIGADTKNRYDVLHFVSGRTLKVPAGSWDRMRREEHG